MRIQKDFRAVSTILAVLLILAAAILGGLISYMWAIAPFYATPSNVSLNITSANFPLYHADYFVVTVLNPSYSSSGTNITSIYVTVANETNVLNVTNTNPILPVFVDIGASVTIQCNFNWGAYAGKNITVSVSPQSGTGATYIVHPSFVGFTANAYFNGTDTVESFVMIVQNDANSAINLTLAGVSIDGTAVSDFSITLPKVIYTGNSSAFTCFFDWQGHANPQVVAETQEGYNAEVTEQVNASSLLLVDNVQFNETDSGRINVTLLNAPGSTTPVNIANVTIAHGNITDVINGTLSNPALPYLLDVNANVTLNCAWSWANDSYRNMTIRITAFTSQGFISQTATFTTPGEVAARVDQTEFDLGETGHFTVNVTNLPYSLQQINMTEIDFNNNAINISSPLLAIGGQAAFVCEFNWSSFVGQQAKITAHVTYGNNSLLLPFQTNVTYFEISNVSFSDFSLGNPYMNVTVSNSQFSKTSANITQIFIQTENGTQTIDGTISYPQINPQYLLAKGTQQTITCPWNWSPYSGQDVTVIVQTADGFQVSITVKA
ncbi:MAG TPA: hypothetical protein VMT42_06780 [candidate division Zixibacteria bacterium]|nr:hypothetical protein [candidate division Zixibacteria bacterium]